MSYWLNLLTESLVAAVVEGFALAAVAFYVWYRQRRALRQGKLEDAVLVSYNQIVEVDGAPQLAFRTPLSGSMRELFLNEGLIKEIKRAASDTSDQDPLVRLRDPKLHAMMQRGMVNFCNQLNISGQVAALSGQPFIEREHLLVLTYEPGAVTKMFRILLIQRELFAELDRVGDELTFSMPYHRDRLVALKAIRKELQLDESREWSSRVLASFMVAAPQNVSPNSAA